MVSCIMKGIRLCAALLSIGLANGYWLMGAENFLVTERLDPLVSPGKVATHVHSVLGGSNFGPQVSTASLRQSQCSSIPIPQDKSAYWFPHLYFQWRNGSFTSLTGGAVIYYLFDDKGTAKEFPDDFRMLSGDPTLRTYDPSSYAQQAVTFLCLDFHGVTSRHNSLPWNKACPDGIRAQINFPSCWDGKNTDSQDHKSHVAFPSGGPDSGRCSDPNFPVTLARIFIEIYWASNEFERYRSQAMNTTQPFVYAYGDRTGYGYHADFINGWDKGVLQRAIEGCNCDQFGSPDCCVRKGIFDMNHDKNCRITRAVDEAATGTLAKLPGNNPVQEEGRRAVTYTDPNSPAILTSITYTGDVAPGLGTVLIPAHNGGSSDTSSGGSNPSNGGNNGNSGGSNGSGNNGGSPPSNGNNSNNGGSNGSNGNNNSGNGNGDSSGRPPAQGGSRLEHGNSTTPPAPVCGTGHHPGHKSHPSHSHNHRSAFGRSLRKVRARQDFN